jgi:hypothetical protein
MSDIQVNNRTIGTITLIEQGMRGEGGPHDPRIILPLAFTLHPQPPGAMLALTELRCSLHLSAPASSSNQIGPTVTVPLLENMSCRSVPGAPLTGQIEVRFPLTEKLIAHLEASRHQHPEGAFLAYLGLHGVVVWLYATGNVTPPGIKDHPLDLDLGPFSILAPFWYPRIGDLSIQLPASIWVDHVYSPLGFGSLRLIEVALPAANGLLPNGLIASLDAARRDYDLGNYRECIQKCRDARYAVENHLEATRANPVAAVIGDRLELPPDAPQRAFLRSVWTGLSDMTNAAHHVSTVQGMLRADAHACLLTLALLLEYISQLR